MTDFDRRPTGSNADEWHLFLSEHLDNRANFPNGLTYVAVQIAEAIDAATPAVGGDRFLGRCQHCLDNAYFRDEAQLCERDPECLIRREREARSAPSPKQPAAAPEMFRCNCPHEVRSGCSEPRCAHYIPPRATAPPFQPHENCNCLMCLAEKPR